MTVAVFVFIAKRIPMKRKPVCSSVIASIGYGPGAILEIEFKTGLIYRYRSVPRAKVRAFLAADSKGRYFNAHIRDRYDYEQRPS